METRSGYLRTPRAIGVACASAATGLGLVYMAAAGAPAIYLAVNALALVMGLAIVALMQSSGQALRLPSGVAVALGGLLLATALFGGSVEGASRWIRIGGLSLQISLIVLPAMLVAFAQRRVSPPRSVWFSQPLHLPSSRIVPWPVCWSRLWQCSH